MRNAAVILALLLLGACGGPPQAPSEPRRVIALAPSIAEQMFALGLEGRLVAVSDYCDWPPEAARLPSVGSYANPSLEAVLALQPDLVVAAFGTRRSALARLAAVGVPVRLSDPRTVEQSIEALGEMAGWCGAPGAADELAAGLRERLARVRAAVRGAPKPRVYFQLYPGELASAGEGSLQGDLIREAGGLNVAAGVAWPYPRLSLEHVLAQAPEVVIVATDDCAAFEAEKRRWLAQPLPAARTGSVFRLPAGPLLQPGPRLVEGLELLAARLHPERFPPPQPQPEGP